METKSVFASIVGRPNVGKSSLLNRLVGEKVSIVSAKPQTTRTRITGIRTEGDLQMVFIDTPGLHKARTRLGEYMVKQVRESVTDVDVAVLMVEPRGGVNEAERELIKKIQDSAMPAILVINKVDLLKEKEALLERINQFQQLHQFDKYIPISALTGDGVGAFLQELAKFAVESPHYFEDDSITDQPERVLAAEIIREKMLYYLNEEVPHGVGVVVERMQERPGKDITDIDATVYCERKTHKGIIIGKSGSMLKKIASEAREDMESFFGCKVNLQVWVKIKDDWRNREGVIRTLGFE